MRHIVYRDGTDTELELDYINKAIHIQVADEIWSTYNLSEGDIEDLILDLIEMKKQFENE